MNCGLKAYRARGRPRPRRSTASCTASSRCSRTSRATAIAELPGQPPAARARPLALRARALPARLPRPAHGLVHGPLPAPAAAPLRRARARCSAASGSRVLVYLTVVKLARARDRQAAAADARRAARRRRHAVLLARPDQRDDHEPPRGARARARAARRARRGSALVARLRVLYFGTYERDYPRNAQVISCLRGAGVEVVERHASVWEGREHKFGARARLGAAARARRGCGCSGGRAATSTRSSSATRGTSTCRRRSAPRAGGRSSSTRSSRSRTRSSPTAGASGRARSPARVLCARSTAQRFAPPTSSSPTRRRTRRFFARARRAARRGLLRRRGGARSSRPAGGSRSAFTCLFVGKLIPLHGLETILEAARLAPELRVPRRRQRPARARCSTQRPANVEWRAVGRVRAAARASCTRAGCALGIFGTSAKARRVIPNKVVPGARLRHAGRHRGHAGRARAARRRTRARCSSRRATPDALADALRRLAADPELARRIAAGGRSRVSRARERGDTRRTMARADRRAPLAVWRRRRRVRGRLRRALDAAPPRRSRPAASTSGTWCRRCGRRRTAIRCASRTSRGEQVLAARRARRPGARCSSRRSGGSGRAPTCCSSRRRSRSRSARCRCTGSRASTSARSARALGFALAYLLYPRDDVARAERVPSRRARDARAAVRVLVPRRGPARAVRGLRAARGDLPRGRSRSSSPGSASGTRSRAAGARAGARSRPRASRGRASRSASSSRTSAAAQTRVRRALQRGARAALARSVRRCSGLDVRPRAACTTCSTLVLPLAGLCLLAPIALAALPGARAEPPLGDADADVDPLPLHRRDHPAARRRGGARRRARPRARWRAAGRVDRARGGAARQLPPRRDPALERACRAARRCRRAPPSSPSTTASRRARSR